MSEYIHSGSGDARGSSHKANSDTDQRKQVSPTSFSIMASYVVCFDSC